MLRLVLSSAKEASEILVPQGPRFSTFKETSPKPRSLMVETAYLSSKKGKISQIPRKRKENTPSPMRNLRLLANMDFNSRGSLTVIGALR